jgi:DNA-directed RNA polymerase I, II, and III subunit RPABC2
MEHKDASSSNVFITSLTLLDKLNSPNKQTNPFFTKYEKAKCIGFRAEMLANGSNTTVNTEGMTDVVKIAEKELKERKLPLIIQRTLPDGTTEYWRLDELEF